MNENINLCEILKGHEGEKFYNPLFGNIKLVYINDGYIVFSCNLDLDELFIKHNGNSKDTDEPAIFPSKDQRDWNKWVEEQNPKVPKTWSELVKAKDIFTMSCDICSDNGIDNSKTFTNTSIEKSALALLKIHQLIEVGYGGNVLCNKEKHWEGGIIGYTISIKPSSKSYLDGYEIISVERRNNVVSPIMFKTKEYAEEFIKYEENCSLLRIFNMVAYPRDINSISH